MGAGIATSFLVSGRHVRIIESSPEAAERATASVTDSLARLARRNEILDPADILTRLELALDHEGDNDRVTAVIEAIPEQLQWKQALFADIEDRYPTEAILASNTGSLSIGAIAEAVAIERVIGMHFFNPVPVSSLVEFVVSDRTSDPVLATARAMTEEVAKTRSSCTTPPVRVEPSRWCSGSRRSGCSRAGGGRAGHRPGDGTRLQTSDEAASPHRLVGLDPGWPSPSILHRARPRFEPPQLLQDLVAEGHLGKKTGRSYDWS